MSKQESSESFHSETHVFDPVEYIRAYYSGPDNFPCPHEKEVVEWTVDKIQGMFVGGMLVSKNHFLYLNVIQRNSNVTYAVM